jgi:hypothetical protein
MTGPAKPPHRAVPLAYHDRTFLDGDAARPLRILAEYIHPFETFKRQRVRETIVFFGSARIAEGGPLGRYYDDARELARLVTAWARERGPDGSLVVCTGGGPGIMEAANRGAADAGGSSIGLNIGLPHEQRPNPYITRELLFEFHYFFMRKLWFAYLARAIVVFPGGFGTLDEMFEILTLSQTRKLSRSIRVLLYGSAFWKEIIDFPALERQGMIARGDLELFRFVDDPAAAMSVLKESIEPEVGQPAPAMARSVTPADPAPEL